MSVFTKSLGLFQYEQGKDDARTFNLDDALNQNWDKIDNAMERTLPGGEIDKALLNKANVLEGTYTPQSTGHATLLSFALSLRTASVTSLIVSGFPDLPRTDWGFQAEIRRIASISVRAKRLLSNDEVYEREVNTTGTGWMGAWSLIATAAPPLEMDLSLEEGWTASNPCTLSKGQDSRAYVHIDADRNTPVTQMSLICRLPRGYWPRAVKRFTAISVNSDVTIFCFVNPLGELYVYPYGGITTVVGDVSFLTA